jgi:hypothetical protein
MQIFKNYGAEEVIVSSMQTELHGSVSRLRKFRWIWLNDYHFWKLHIFFEFERWSMHVNLMREKCLYLSLEYYLPILDQWWIRVRGPNIPKWPAILSMNFTKSFLPLVKKLPIFEYKWLNVKLYSSISCEDRILRNLSDFSRKVWTPLKFEEDSKFILFQNF